MFILIKIIIRVYNILIRANNTVLYLLLFGQCFVSRFYVFADNSGFVTVNPTRSGEEVFKAPPPLPKFCSHAFIFEAASL